MDHRLTELVDDLYARSREHDARQANRLDRWRNVEPDTAQLMAVLIRALAPSRLLELGSSNGYSTIWLADAARAVGGHLVTVEIDPLRSAQANDNLRRAGFDDEVGVRVGDAADVLAESDNRAWDFIFLDAERAAYAGYWPDLVRVLAHRGLLVVDNVISHASEVAEFRELVSRDRRVTAAVAATGAGVLLVAREPLYND